MVILDIEKIYKIYINKYPTFLVKLVQSLLTNIKSSVFLNDTSSDYYLIPDGVPQGSLLSPHMFNISINDIPRPHQCLIEIYADDTALNASIPYKTHIITLIDKI